MQKKLEQNRMLFEDYKVRTRRCSVCRKKFKYQIARGNDRKHCSKECKRVRRIALRTARFEGAGYCRIEKCERKATRPDGVCETHYYRRRRTGSYYRDPPKGKTNSSHGYVKVKATSHVMADKSGYAYEHRAVLFDELGDGPHRCYWCDTWLEWDAIVVDHLNEDKSDNRPDNLVAACTTCNRLRGSLLGLLNRVTPKRLDLLFGLARQYYEQRAENE